MISSLPDKASKMLVDIARLAEFRSYSVSLTDCGRAEKKNRHPIQFNLD